LAALAAGATAAAPARAGTIVFNTDAGGTTDIAFMADAGGAATLLSPDASALDQHPRVSPDGRKIVFESTRGGFYGVWTMGLDGGAPTSIVDGEGVDGLPSWSPDGTQLVFQSDRDGGNFEIYIAPADGSSLGSPFAGSAAYESDPDWSSTGLIAFERDAGSGKQIWVQPADQSVDPVQVTSGSAPASQPAFSPDGSLIAFTSPDIENDDLELWTVGADGTGLQQRTTGFANEQHPEWSPGGTQLVYASDEFGQQDLFRRALSGGTPVRLTSTAANESLPDWTAAPPPPVLTVGSPAASEGAGTLDFTLTLDHASADPVSVAVETADGTADAVDDYGQIVTEVGFAVGETQKVVKVPIVSDGVFEVAETVGLRVTGGSGAVVPDPLGIGRIGNDDAFPRGSDGLLAYECIQSTVDVCVRDVQSGFEVNVTQTSLQNETAPALSPDGTRVAYVREGTLVSVELDGDDPRQPAGDGSGDRDPTWTPDGAAIVFVQEPGVSAPPELARVAAAGGTPEPIAFAPVPADPAKPDVSPDGTRLAFACACSGEVSAGPIGGGAATVLAAGAHPAWSPDGAKLAFERDEGVWTMAADGGSPVELYRQDGHVSEQPVWSPDGGRVAFTLRPQEGYERILAVAPGSAPVELASGVDSGRQLREPDWWAPEASPPAVDPPRTEPPAATPTPTPAPTAAPAPSATPSPTPAPSPEPQENRTVVGAAESGKVLVRLPGSTRFIDLSQAKSLPNGTVVDTRKGKVALTAERGSATDRSDFFDGLFVLRQSGGITTLTLQGAIGPCPKAGTAQAAARKKRRLWGDGKGRFRSAGKYASATVRGTKWLVEDSCAGTLTRVTRGVVTVRDAVRRRSVTVRKGKRYLARPRSVRNR
jgi:Tol biopolymer transport system component